MMKRLLIALALAACSSPGLTPATPPAVVHTDAALAARVDPVIDKAIAEQKLVGIVMLVARDGELVYSRASGFADREAKLAMRDDTQFRFASMTKPIVTATAMTLVEQNKLSLDDPVTKWLPDFRPKLPDGREPVITVRQLMTHTSGLTYKFLEPAEGPYHKANVPDGIAEPGLGMAEFLKRLGSVPLVNEPGTKWVYSLSIDVLGAVIEKAAGEPLPAAVAHRITQPLGMGDTTFVVTDKARLAWPYGNGTPPARMTEPFDATEGSMSVRFSPARIFDPGSFPSGGAGLAGTARDYLRFCETLRTGGGRVLKPATVQAMTTNELPAGLMVDAGVGFGFGFGIVLDPAAAKSSQGTGTYTWAGIYGTSFWVDPAAKLTVVILTNATAGPPQELEHAIYGVTSAASAATP